MWRVTEIRRERDGRGGGGRKRGREEAERWRVERNGGQRGMEGREGWRVGTEGWRVQRDGGYGAIGTRT